MNALTSVSDHELRERLSAAVSTERSACANVIFHLAELDRRRLYLGEACSSLFAYCTERLGYSEDSATKRVRVARLVQQFPQVLDELASGEIHLTGLFLLSQHLTDDNAPQLLAEARGKSKRQIGSPAEPEELAPKSVVVAGTPPAAWRRTRIRRALGAVVSAARRAADHHPGYARASAGGVIHMVWDR